MEIARFFLYYGLIMHITFCMFIFNPKLEWALLIAMFYTIILFIYGLASAINKATQNAFVYRFNNVIVIKSISEFILNYTPFDATEYLKYLILLPPLFNLASIKLITNYDGNKKIHLSKSKLKLLDATKLLVCASAFLLAIIVFFGFSESFVPPIAKNPIIPLVALGLLYMISTAELAMSIIIYLSY
jgi:hypothetical protein